MKFSEGERLILVMLADLMEHLEVRGEVEPALVKTLVVNNDEWALKWQYGGLFGGEGRNPDDVDETADILSMMSFIEYSVAELPEADRADLDLHLLSFRGFDGNHDNHFGIAHTMIEDLGRWSEFKGRSLNSHSQSTLRDYRALLPVYKSLRTGVTGGGLSIDQLKTLSAARGR